LLFDLDETLLDNRGVPAAVARTCEWVAAAVEGLDAQQLRRANTEVWLSYWPQVEESCWLGRMNGFSASREAWRQTLQACGCTDESVAHRAFEQYRQFSRNAYRLFTDAVDLLAQVARTQLRIALVTNGPSDLQRDKLQFLGIENFFHAIVISGEISVAKPSPEPFLLALQQLAVPPRDAWHIGDSLATDVAGARSAGVPSVWLNRGITPSHNAGSPPDIEVTSLSDIAALLQA
jgi:HAD superfamily hydrolase (TIGR01549 family)